MASFIAPSGWTRIEDRNLFDDTYLVAGAGRSGLHPESFGGSAAAAAGMDSLGLYCRDLSKLSLAGAEEEASLLAAVRRGGESGAAAKRRLIEANLRLVLWMARRMGNGWAGMDLMDLVQEGNLGLMEAIDEYANGADLPFGWLRQRYVRMAMARAIQEKGRTIRIPRKAWMRSKELGRLSEQVREETLSRASLVELAAKAGLPVREVEKCIALPAASSSIDAPLNGQEQLLSDVLADPRQGYIERAVIAADLHDKLQRQIAALPALAREFVRMRYGLSGSPAISTTEISRRLALGGQAGLRRFQMQVIGRLRSALGVLISPPPADQPGRQWVAQVESQLTEGIQFDLSALSDFECEVFRMRFHEGETLKAIAGRLGRSYYAIYKACDSGCRKVLSGWQPLKAGRAKAQRGILDGNDLERVRRVKFERSKDLMPGVLEIIRDLHFSAPGRRLSIAELKRLFENRYGAQLDRKPTSRELGAVLRVGLGVQVRKSAFVVGAVVEGRC
jgi:RNA polymerase sigma factor (sigma-70 family)